MGRPPKSGDSKLLKLAVPAALWNYLSLLAKVSPLGSSETEVGLYLLKEQVKGLQREKYHEVASTLGVEHGPKEP
jgi:hypothetical protein